jgi:hypothetical protein
MEQNLVQFRKIVLPDFKQGSETYSYASSAFKAGWAAALTHLLKANEENKKIIIREYLEFLAAGKVI